MEQEYIFRLLLAAVVTGAIGIEREYRDKSAGFRTMILIGVGAALFTILSREIAEPTGDDVARIASSIVSGIGFLGAGVIIKDGLNIKGLTTAATIWLVAALGMGIGAGFELITITAALIILFALIVLPHLEHWIDRIHEYKRYEITLKSKKDFDVVLQIFNRSKLSIFHSHKSKREGKLTLTIDADGKPDYHHRVIDELLEVKGVESLN